MLRRVLSLLGVLLIAAACTSVDETEWCVKTQFGKVKQERMPTGLEFMPMHEATCFDMTDQNFPDDGEATTMEAQTNDPVTVQSDVSVIFAYDPASLFDVFLDKRSEQDALIESMQNRLSRIESQLDTMLTLYLADADDQTKKELLTL